MFKKRITYHQKAFFLLPLPYFCGIILIYYVTFHQINKANGTEFLCGHNIIDHDAKQYSLIDNYRSCQSIVTFANQFVKTISERMKTEDIAAVVRFICAWKGKEDTEESAVILADIYFRREQ